MPAANTVHVVVKMHRDAHVIRYDLHHIADAWPPGAPAEMEHAVLLRHALHDHLGMIQQLAKSFARTAHRLALRQRPDARVVEDEKPELRAAVTSNVRQSNSEQ